MDEVAIDRGLHQLLYDSIENKRLVRFTYNNKVRIVEPHDYGVQKGITRLLSWQIGGQSKAVFRDGVGLMLRKCKISKRWTGRFQEIGKFQASIISGTRSLYGWNRRSQ